MQKVRVPTYQQFLAYLGGCGEAPDILCSDLTIYGTPFNDLIDLNGTNNSTIYADAGVDVIDLQRATGASTLYAGAGDDVVYVNGDSSQENSFLDDEILDGGDGTDWLIIVVNEPVAGLDAPSIDYTLNSSPTANFENVRSGLGDDRLVGDEGDNRLVGVAGADTLLGGDGADYLYGYVDHLWTAMDFWRDGDDQLFGGAGDDVIRGAAGDDYLDGGPGKDVLYGEGGALSGQPGDVYTETTDEANGGASGADTFVTRLGDGAQTIGGADVIMDFEDGIDLIGLDGIAFSDLTIEQGTGQCASDAFVKDSTGYLFVLQGVSAASLSDLDFTPIESTGESTTGAVIDESSLFGRG